MSKAESSSIDTSEPGFVRMRHVQQSDDGGDLGGEIWFERASLEPFVHLYNQRPSGASHAGDYTRKLSQPVALRLVDELAALR